MYIKNSKLTFFYRLFVLLLCGTGLVMHLSLTDMYNNQKMLSFFTIQSVLFCFFLFLLLTFSSIQELKTKNIKKYRYKFPRIRGIVTFAILTTFCIYRLVLRGNGFSMYSVHDTFIFSRDLLVHFIIPLLVFIDYFLFEPKGLFHQTDCLMWLIFPFFYFSYIELRGVLMPADVAARIPKYPYFFLNSEKLGTARILLYLGILMLILLFAAYMIYLFDYLLGFFAHRRMERHKKKLVKRKSRQQEKGAEKPAEVIEV